MQKRKIRPRSVGHTCNQSFRRLRKQNNELRPVLYSEPLSGTQKGKKKINVAGKALGRPMMKN